VTKLLLLLLLSCASALPAGPGEGRATRSLATFLSNNGLDTYLPLFIEQGVTLDILPMFTEPQLERLGIRTFGERLRFVRSAQNLNLEEYEEVEADNEIPVNENENVEEPEIPVNRNEAEDRNMEENNTLETTRRGEEEPEFYTETSAKGDKKFHKFKVGFDRFDRKWTKKSGVSHYRCHHKGCSSFLTAYYPNFDTWQEDEPQLTSGPTPHMVEGLEHPPDIGQRLKELANRKMKQQMKADPLKPTPEIQEEVVNSISEAVTEIERDEFLRTMPKPGNAQRNLYRVRGRLDAPSAINRCWKGR